jgi:hypothetical protein
MLCCEKKKRVSNNVEVKGPSVQPLIQDFMVDCIPEGLQGTAISRSRPLCEDSPTFN